MDREERFAGIFISPASRGSPATERGGGRKGKRQARKLYGDLLWFFRMERFGLGDRVCGWACVFIMGGARC